MKYYLLLMYPFLGTIIGSACVFFLKNKMNEKIEKIMLGFASGVMLAASIWSLLIPAIDLSSRLGKMSWIPASVGFLLGILLLILFEKIIYQKKDNSFMMPLAVTLHNIPEGMVIGVTVASLLFNNAQITYPSVLALSLGIAIQNLPEGAIISLTLKSKGMPKFKAFIVGALSGIVEPIASIITLLFMSVINMVLPYTLAFASGAMIYVIIEELIPDAYSKDSKLLIISLTIGFELMMILDVMLG